MTITERYGTVLRLYDNGGRSFDRYTIIPPRWAREYRHGNLFASLGASENPSHPQGYGRHGEALPGPHLGRRVRWADLPAPVRAAARGSFPEYAPK